jgi:3-oxoacyl-(acyl-carrier-protein) synthase III
MDNDNAYRGLQFLITHTNGDQWPNYSYVLPNIYTRAGIRLVGLGGYVPKGIITNEFFAYIATRLGSPRHAEDLERVTGLETRHVRASTLKLCREMAGAEAPGLIDDSTAPRDELAIDMAEVAARRALASAGRDASEIDTIIAASSSDNDAFPTIAGLLQLRLGCGTIRTTTLKGACACQTEAFQVCSEVLTANSAKLVLMVASEVLLPNIMHVLDWKTSSLFGEGAIAFLLELGDEDTYLINGSDARQAQYLFYQSPLRKDTIAMAEVDMKIRQLYREGRGAELNQIFSQHLVGYAKMNGKEVYREAPRAMAECVDALCRHADLRPDELSHIVPHQANSRITRRLGELLINDYGWPQTTMDKLADHYRYYGNLSNASIGMALIEMLRQGHLQEGQWMALPAVGGGMNYGCWLLRFHGLENPGAVFDPA